MRDICRAIAGSMEIKEIALSGEGGSPMLKVPKCCEDWVRCCSLLKVQALGQMRCREAYLRAQPRSSPGTRNPDCWVEGRSSRIDAVFAHSELSTRLTVPSPEEVGRHSRRRVVSLSQSTECQKDSILGKPRRTPGLVWI